jgi:WXG100 family type VII secretion target
MNENIRVRYDELERIANTFVSQADDLDSMMSSLRACYTDLLSDGFKGKAAKSFNTEMGEDVLPAVKRLDEALRNASFTIGEVKTLFEEAEQNSYAAFDKTSVPG